MIVWDSEGVAGKGEYRSQGLATRKITQVSTSEIGVEFFEIAKSPEN